MKLSARQFATAHEAIQYAEAQGGEAIRLGGKYLVIGQDDALRLTAAGVAFAYLGDHDGQIVTVPVN